MDNTKKNKHLNSVLKQEIENLAVVTAPMIIASTDECGEIITINPAVRTMFGYMEGEMEGCNLLSLIPELEKLEYDEFEEFSDRGDLELFDAKQGEHKDPEEYNYLEKFIYGRVDGEQIVDVKTKDSDGNVLWVEMYIHRAKIQLKTYFIVIIHDITEKKLNDEEVLALNTLLEERVRELRT
ncbi:MAG: PAS domain S-box protein [Gammaproteobacteria bacterium]|nr:PAS domain S-box protein [Gammaproteobacteria bacterium]